jgi:hypothetical protein
MSCLDFLRLATDDGDLPRAVENTAVRWREAKEAEGGPSMSKWTRDVKWKARRAVVGSFKFVLLRGIRW